MLLMIVGRNSKQKFVNSTKILLSERLTNLFYLYDMDKDTVRISILKNSLSQVNQINFIDNVAESKYGTCTWDESVFFFVFFCFFLNLHITSYWSKLDGNGEIVWGRTFFSTFNLSYNLLYDTFSGPSVDLSGN